MTGLYIYIQKRCSTYFFFSVNGRRFGNDSCSGVPRCFTLSPVYHGPDDECTRQKPHKRLVNTNHRIPSLLPSHVPSRRVKTFVKCLSSSRPRHRRWVIPPPTCLSSPPLFSFLLSSFLISLNLSLLHPSSHTLRGCRICVCVVVCVCVVSWCVRAVTEPI